MVGMSSTFVVKMGCHRLELLLELGFCKKNMQHHGTEA